MNAAFLNVDLEIESHENLQPIVTNFGDRVFTLYCGEARGYYLATFELSDISVTNADGIITNFCLLIESFDREANMLWDSAISKVFDLGYRGGLAQIDRSTEIDPITLAKVASLGASIRMTIYPQSNY
jgi:hypothetical protein